MTRQRNCGIYEVISSTGRKSYKIFDSQQAFESYLSKQNRTAARVQPVYQQAQFKNFPATQIRKLSTEEQRTYLQEQEQLREM
ncbi:hypothetical protein NRIC_10900 [Enterococcus florum]|uniref:Uncharacterized protein n=1 Tax=Enterococcus florum TaxID=2480627 RepID=A0A4V0WPA7_9ENTE|nr:hypothetical protein [Enterococcus florum]GCF93199.1 hypothetical protein NRIC_10900 [Enterococcus florum]